MPSNKPMWGVIVVIVLVIGAYFWYTQSHSGSNEGSPAAMNATGSMPGTAQQAGASDTSDTAIAQDSASIDAQLSGLSSDNASMNQTDQPVSQSY